jgi:hypothetical protein
MKWSAPLFVAALLTLSWSAPAFATVPQEPAPDLHAEAARSHAPLSSDVEARPSVPDPDFFFQRPVWTLTIRGGGFFPRAQGQFFDFAVEEFTLSRGDFRGFSGGGDVGVWLTDRLEIMGSVDVASVTRQSHYPTDVWVEVTPQGDELPIRQTTRLRQGPTVTAGLKFYPTARGEQLSQFMWVPSQVAPYLSGGVGGVAWNVELWGDFVDESDVGEDGTFGIITSDFTSDGFSFASFLGAGVDITLTPRMSLTLDSRYLWSEGQMDQDFSEFTRPLDLSGLRLSAGLSFRY